MAQTHAEITEALYSATSPTKKKAYLYLSCGCLMAAGHHTANANLTAADYALYAKGSANDPNEDPATIALVDFADLWRFDGFSMVGKEIGTYQYRWLLLNKWRSIYGSFATGDTLVAPEMSFMVDAKANGYFSDGTIFFHGVRNIDTYIVNGEATLTWSTSSTRLTNSFKEFDMGIKYLEYLGYEVDILGLLFGIKAKSTTGSTDVAVYRAEAEAINAAIRNKYKVNLPILWAVNSSAWSGAQSAALRTGVLNADAADAYMDVFDCEVNCLSAVPPYPRTKSVVNMGKLMESLVIKYRSGLDIPVVSNVAISGTLKVGQVITPTYTFTGGVEGDSNYILLRADNTSGLNETFIQTYQKGETITLGAVSGKYLKFIVTPVQTTNPKTGVAVRNANWEGPVSA